MGFSCNARTTLRRTPPDHDGRSTTIDNTSVVHFPLPMFFRGTTTFLTIAALLLAAACGGKTQLDFAGSGRDEPRGSGEEGGERPDEHGKDNCSTPGEPTAYPLSGEPTAYPLSEGALRSSVGGSFSMTLRALHGVVRAGLPRRQLSSSPRIHLRQAVQS